MDISALLFEIGLQLWLALDTLNLIQKYSYTLLFFLGKKYALYLYRPGVFICTDLRRY